MAQFADMFVNKGRLGYNFALYMVDNCNYQFEL